MSQYTRRCLGALAAAAGLMAAPAISRAQAPRWPSRPITLLVPNPPGGGTDFAARLYADGLSRALGQPVVIENRPGANGNIATVAVARAAPDGHTLLLQYVGYYAGNPAMMRNLQWSPQDLTAVGMATIGPHVIVVAPNLPVSDLRSFIAYVRERPGRVNYASSGSGSIQHIGGVLFAKAIGSEMVHVPYRGAAPALQDVAGGRVEMFITTPPSAIGLIQGGQLRALALASERRHPSLAEVPTTAEAGLPGFTLDAWFGIMAPAGTPTEIVERLNTEMRRLAETPEIRQRAEAGGVLLKPMTTAEMNAQLAADLTYWGGVIREANITIE
jgi:tripartite-type tricarboxylate transporter receptor subunit TctC